MMRNIPLLCCFLGFVFCSAERTVLRAQGVFVETLDAQGDSLLGVEVFVDGKKANIVGEDNGVLSVELFPSEKLLRKIAVVCPGDSQKKERILQSGGFKKYVIPRLTFECPVTESRLALLISTGISNIKLYLDGAPVGETDEDGHAHLSFESTPGVVHHIRMDASHNNKVKPKHFERSLTVPGRDALIVIEEGFRKIKKRRKKAKTKNVGPIKFVTL